MASPESFPEWMSVLRKGTPEEGQGGIDYVAHTDVGKLFLQVKSSEWGKKDAEKKHPRGHIGVIVVHAKESLVELGERIIRVLKDLRIKYLSERQADKGAGKGKTHVDVKR